MVGQGGEGLSGVTFVALGLDEAELLKGFERAGHARGGEAERACDVYAGGGGGRDFFEEGEESEFGEGDAAEIECGVEAALQGSCGFEQREGELCVVHAVLCV